MGKIRGIFRFLLGDKNYLKLSLKVKHTRNFITLLKNFYVDFTLYYKHSTVFKQETFSKLEALIILKYHSLEKGLLHEQIRYRFGSQIVVELGNLLKMEEIVAEKNQTQIAAAYVAMCNYYELHEQNNIDISDFFPASDYTLFKQYSNLNLSSIKKQSYSDYFEKKQ